MTTSIAHPTLVCPTCWQEQPAARFRATGCCMREHPSNPQRTTMIAHVGDSIVPFDIARDAPRGVRGTYELVGVDWVQVGDRIMVQLSNTGGYIVPATVTAIYSWLPVTVDLDVAVHAAVRVRYDSTERAV